MKPIVHVSWSNTGLRGLFDASGCMVMALAEGEDAGYWAHVLGYNLLGG